jgi:hypothetical protein
VSAGRPGALRRPGLSEHRGEQHASDRTSGIRRPGGRGLPGRRLVGGRWLERVFDAARDRVDRFGVFADRVERAVFAPAGDVGDRFATDVEPGGAADDVGGAVDEDFGLLAAVLLVAESECVRELVDERADLAVGGSRRYDDLPVLWVAPAAGAGLGQLADLGAVAEFVGERGERREQVGVAVALDRVLGRGQRDGFGAGERVGHADIEHRDRAEVGRFSPVSSPVLSRCLMATGARIRIAVSPLRTQRLSARNARKPAT